MMTGSFSSFSCLKVRKPASTGSVVLKKRENYRKAFHNFAFEQVARYTDRDLARLLADPGIVRNRLKIASSIKNAQGVVAIIEHYGSLDAFLWRYVDGTPIQNAWRRLENVPAQTKLSDQISKDLKRKGLSFVGSTICYAFMQAVGMVNDHLTDCFRSQEIARINQESLRQKN